MMAYLTVVPVIIVIYSARKVHKMLEAYKTAMENMALCQCKNPDDRPEIIKHTTVVCAPLAEHDTTTD